MAKPRPDHVGLNASFEQMDCGGVAPMSPKT